MAIELPAGLAELLGQIQSGVRTGFQRSHSIGTAFHRKLSGWLRNIDFNVDAELPVDHIGVRFTDGQVVDYTVQLTDADGTFYVWARNLDRALQLEWKTGDSREFALRNYAIDFAHLDEVNSSHDSTFRVELLTPAQFHFATSLGGIDFQPAMLSATLNETSRMSRRAAAACNDNDAWRGATFRFAAAGRMAA